MTLLRRRILELCQQGLKPTVSLSAQRKCPQLRPLRQPLPTAAHLSAFGSLKTLRKNSHAAKTAPVYVAADARNTTTANVAVGYAAAIIEEFNASRQVRSVLELKDRYRYNENGITRWNIMTGLILGLAMIQVMLLAGLAVSREREEGSFDMMLMTPLTPVEILIGKAVPPIVIGVLQSAMIFAVCRWWFDIPFAGSLALLFGVVLHFCGQHRGAGTHDFRLGADTAAVGCSMLHSAAPFTRPLRPHDADSSHARMDADHYHSQSRPLRNSRGAHDLL